MISIMDKKTLEKELSKSFENVRADETNVVSCHGVRAVYKEAVHRDFESRHSGIQDEDRYWSNYKKSSEMLDEMYKSIRAEELCLGEAGPIIVFPEDLSKLEELEGSPWFLLGQLANAMGNLECSIDGADEDDSELLGDIRGRFEEAKRLVEAMQSISSRVEDQPEK